jgi:XRE family aerobic/anaerobic benzoate catabolism transcriptional regulator
LLASVGERIRTLRARRGTTRRALAQAADVSERHLANLESGGNASVLVLSQIAMALECSLSELVGDVTTTSPEWLLIRDLLARRDEAALRRARIALSKLFDTAGNGREKRIALVGLRGAGKSTLGPLLANDLGLPFVELSREIERVAGCSIAEIHALYGTSAYRRYERRALEETIASHAQAVIATPGGMVSDATTFNFLIAQCFTVWLRARPEDHMRRVTAQGDLRPMAASREAMADLRRILEGRAPFYAKADLTIDTSAAPLEATLHTLRASVRARMAQPA